MLWVPALSDVSKRMKHTKIHTMKNLRIVKFTLEGQDDMTAGDYMVNMSAKEADETTKIRNGYFHTWGNEFFWNANDEKFVERIIGVVEEIENGKVYHIIPKRITFLQSDSPHLV